MEIEISDDDRDLLVELLQSDVKDLRSGEYHAESHQYKEMLRDREERDKHLLEALLGRKVDIAV